MSQGCDGYSRFYNNYFVGQDIITHGSINKVGKPLNMSFLSVRAKFHSTTSFHCRVKITYNNQSLLI